jgi:hypothetical protein
LGPIFRYVSGELVQQFLAQENREKPECFHGEVKE